MWIPYTREQIGFFRAFSDRLDKYQRAVPGSIPNLRSSSGMLVFSDYGGEHAGSEFDSYTFLFTTNESVADWLPVRSIWRENLNLEFRRMAYKKLSDGIRQRACFPLLRSADSLHGLLISVAVHKSITSFFSHTCIDRSRPELAQYAHIKPQVLEKLFRVLHLLGFFVGGLSGPKQDLLWISDEDAIVANRERLFELRELLLGVLSIYVRHDMGHLRYGTTASDPGDLSVEDLAAIPDLVTGATCDAMNAYEIHGAMPPLTGVFTKIPDQVSSKANPIFYWLSQPKEMLSKLVFVIYPEPDGSGAIRIIKYRYESKEMPPNEQY